MILRHQESLKQPREEEIGDRVISQQAGGCVGVSEGIRVTYHTNTPLTTSANRTIWYELHAREWPFKTQPAEAIIWQMGTGLKPNLSQIGVGKEISVSRDGARSWGLFRAFFFVCVKCKCFPKG